jgi:hypothetical protein
MNSSKEITKGKERLPTFQLITPWPIKGYNPNILNEEPYPVMFMGTKLPRLGYNGCMQVAKLNSIRNDLHWSLCQSTLKHSGFRNLLQVCILYLTANKQD